MKPCIASGSNRSTERLIGWAGSSAENQDFQSAGAGGFDLNEAVRTASSGRPGSCECMYMRYEKHTTSAFAVRVIHRQSTNFDVDGRKRETTTCAEVPMGGEAALATGAAVNADAANDGAPSHRTPRPQ